MAINEYLMQISIDKSLRKKERLSSKKQIDDLFSNSQSFISYPLRIVYRLNSAHDSLDKGISILASVSKKKFKRAVKRNRVKRLIRETYRLNKSPLSEILFATDNHLDIAFLYLKDQLPEYTEIEKSMQKALNVIIENLKESTT